MPKRCPNRGCRRLAGYKGPSAAVIAEVEKIQKSIKKVEEGQKITENPKTEKKAEKQLSKSEQLRKMREANYGRR